MTKKTVLNTSLPIGGILAFMNATTLGSSENAIEKQEAQGQKELINSDVLPTKLHGGEEAKQKLISLGFLFEEIVSNDPLFQYVTLPSGWKKVATDDAMWSEVHDSEGKPRISMFYKASFHDRVAHMRISQ